MSCDEFKPNPSSGVSAIASSLGSFSLDAKEFVPKKQQESTPQATLLQDLIKIVMSS
jgi:hypothetical protein